MPLVSEKQNEQFIVMASVASKLHHTAEIARTLSLVSMNARVLAIRIGSRVAGFKEMTNFIDQLAKSTISASLRINRQSMSLTKTAAELFRQKQAVLQISHVQKYQYSPQLQEILESIILRQKRDSQAFEKKLEILREDISEVGRELRIARVISVMSNMEAANISDIYRGSFKSVSSNIIETSEFITKTINECRELVRSLIEMAEKENNESRMFISK